MDNHVAEPLEPPLQQLAQAQAELATALANGDEGAITRQARTLSAAMQQSAPAMQRAAPDTIEGLGNTQRQLSIMLQARLSQTRQVIDALGLETSHYAADGRISYQHR